MCKFIERLVEELLLIYNDNGKDVFEKHIVDDP